MASAPDGSRSGADERRAGGARAAAWVRVVAAVALVAAAVACAALSLVDYAWAKEHLDPLAVDSDAGLTPADFDAVVTRLRVLATALVVLAAALLVAGRALDPLLLAIGRGWWLAVRRAPRGLSGWLRAEARTYVAALGLVVALGTAVRLAYLDVAMRYDEATTFVNFVSKPLYVAAANYATPNNHVFHTVLAKASVGVFGNDPWAVRLPALLAGIALIPLAFAFARVFFGRAAALVAAAFVAASSTLVEYSTNARGYTIVAAFALVAFLAAARAVERDSVSAWALVSVSCALGLWTVPVMLYAAGGVFLWIVAAAIVAPRPLRSIAPAVLWCALSTVVLTLVLYAPVYAASGVRSVTSNEFVEPESWSAFAERLPDHAGDTLETWFRDLPAAVGIVVGAGVLAGVVLAPWISRFSVPPLLAIAIWSAVALAVQRVVPFTRVWLPLVPLALATGAGLWGWLLERRPATTRVVPVLATAVALVGSLAVLWQDSPRESRETGALLDAPAIAAYLAARVEPGDRIHATGSDAILEYYLERDGLEAGDLLYTDAPAARTFVVVNVLGGQTVDGLVTQLDADVGALRRPQLLTSYPSGRIYLVERA